jgi:hypothetical protein
MEKSVSGPDGREWVVRSYRLRRPPWRPVDPGLGVLDPDEGLFVNIPGLVLFVVMAPITFVVVPALVFGVEAWARLLRALVTTQRWVEATHAGPPSSRLSWLTDAEHEAAVCEQVGRQLELGYERIQPHRARFLGFG